MACGVARGVAWGVAVGDVEAVAPVVVVGALPDAADVVDEAPAVPDAPGAVAVGAIAALELPSRFARVLWRCELTCWLGARLASRSKAASPATPPIAPTSRRRSTVPSPGRSSSARRLASSAVAAVRRLSKQSAGAER